MVTVKQLASNLQAQRLNSIYQLFRTLLVGCQYIFIIGYWLQVAQLISSRYNLMSHFHKRETLLGICSIDSQGCKPTSKSSANPFEDLFSDPLFEISCRQWNPAQVTSSSKRENIQQVWLETLDTTLWSEEVDSEDTNSEEMEELIDSMVSVLFDEQEPMCEAEENTIVQESPDEEGIVI